MKNIFLSLFIFSSFFSEAQNPLVKQWDYRFGGDKHDYLNIIKQASDSGFIVGGYSYSGISGDRTQLNWDGSYVTSDFWIVKTNASGVKQWDKRYGGTLEDRLYSVAEAGNSEMLLAGYSRSGAGGDISDPSRGGYDYWIVKIDSIGTKLWDKRYGGSGDDRLGSVCKTNDGGFILAGSSNSGAGGDKTQSSQGSSDYWIVKIDSIGNKQWDKQFGGTGDDQLYSIKQTSDGGFVMGGYTFSGIGGDKTTPSWGGTDYWIVKTDSLGVKLWDKDFGTPDFDFLFSMALADDGGIVLAGNSPNGISGDKTQVGWGMVDYWVIKTDVLGNKLWDKIYGGSDSESFTEIEKTNDSGFLLAGSSFSPISGDKSESNLSPQQGWVIKIDSLGTKQWDKTLLSNGKMDGGNAIQTFEGCYVMGNYTVAGIGGDKTQSNQGLMDYWFIKFCDSTQSQLSIAALTSTQNICPGTCTNFINLSSNATSYLWSFPFATPDTSTDVNPTNICYANPGTYDVQLIATNANGSDTLLLTNYITVYPSPPPQGILQNGDTLFAIAGATTYQWYFNGNIIIGATNYFYVAQATGDFNVVATDANGCEVEAAVFNVVASVNAIANQEIFIFPNPVEEKLEVRNRKLETAVVRIYNMHGERVLDFPTSNLQHPTSIDVRALAKGMYWLEINSGEKTFRSKFIKQ